MFYNVFGIHQPQIPNIPSFLYSFEITSPKNSYTLVIASPNEDLIGYCVNQRRKRRYHRRMCLRKYNSSILIQKFNSLPSKQNEWKVKLIKLLHKVNHIPVM